MDSKSKIYIPRLSSTNYRTWSGQMRLVLGGKRLTKYIDSDVNDLISIQTAKLLKEGAPKEETPSPSTSGTALVDSIEAAASIVAAVVETTSRTTLELDPKVSKAIEDAIEALLLGDDQAKMWIGT